MIETKCTQYNSSGHPGTTAIPPDALLGVVVNNHSIAPKNLVQSREEKPRECRYKPFLYPLDSHGKSDEVNGYV